MGTPRLDQKNKAKKVTIPEQRKAPITSSLIEEMRNDPLMTPAEIATLQNVDPKTVTRWCQAGKFGEAPDVIRLPSRTGHRRIRTSAYMRACEEANK